MSPELQELDLSANYWTGEIPPELGSFAKLTSLDLSDSLLSGEIPLELGALDLDALYLGGTNQFWGCIPHSLSDIAASDLADLGLEYCALPRLPVTGGFTSPAWLLTGIALAGALTAVAGAATLRGRSRQLRR